MMNVYVRRMHSGRRKLHTGIREVKTPSPSIPILKVVDAGDGVEVVVKQNCTGVIQSEGVLRIVRCEDAWLWSEE